MSTEISKNSTTRALLTGGVLAGPLYIVIALIQGLTRPGFDLSRHDVSLLSNGDLGWIQIANFLVTGLLVIAGAIGMRKTLRSSQGGTWGPLLVGVYGLGLIGAGIFSADPAFGFPPGTPDGPPAAISWHGLMHFVSAAVGFLSLIAACFVFARRFAAQGQRGWASYSVITGVAFFAAFFGVASGSGQSWTVIVFWIALALAWSWISAMAKRLMTSPVSLKDPSDIRQEHPAGNLQDHYS
jgi:hypothetical protein